VSAESKKVKWSPARDQRKSRRKENVRGGTIVYGRDRRSMPCVLLDISDDGARLVPANIFNCPDRFSLKVADQPDRDCVVVWREHSHMGVKFV
jgi:PilZ domain-containing protein